MRAKLTISEIRRLALMAVPGCMVAEYQYMGVDFMCVLQRSDLEIRGKGRSKHDARAALQSFILNYRGLGVG